MWDSLFLAISLQTCSKPNLHNLVHFLVEIFDILNELGPFCNFEIDDVVEVKIEEGAVESFGDQFESVDGLDDSQISFKLIYSQVNILLGSNTFLINFNNTRFNI